MFLPETSLTAIIEALSSREIATCADALSDLAIRVVDLRRSSSFATEAVAADRVHPDDRDRLLHARATVFSGATRSSRVPFRVSDDSGGWAWVVGSYRGVCFGDDTKPQFALIQELDMDEWEGDPLVWPPGATDGDVRATEAETLRRAAKAVATELDLFRTVRAVLEQAGEVVPFDTAAVELLRDGALEIIDGIGWINREDIVGSRIPVPADNPHTEAIVQQRPVLIRNTNGRFSGFFETGHAVNARSWMGLPLVVHGSVLGLLALKSHTADFFTANHLRLATTFADHVAVAISNAQLHEQTKQLAMTDTLTGALTRRAFFPEAERLLQQSRRYQHPLCVLMIDLDEFKGINDQYGHVVGDAVLRFVGTTVQAVVRASDLVCRFGGDEFVLLMPETGLPTAFDIAERLRATLAGTTIADCPTRTTASIGVAALQEGDSLTELIARADGALYRSKHAGRDRVIAAGASA